MTLSNSFRIRNNNFSIYMYIDFVEAPYKADYYEIDDIVFYKEKEEISLDSLREELQKISKDEIISLFFGILESLA